MPGPAALGRSVVVAGGADPPAPWSDTPAVVVDEAALVAPGAVVGQLHDAWVRRRAIVVRLFVDPARFRVPVSVAAQPWTLPADFELWDDRLHFLVWSNAYDARRGSPDGDAPVWWWTRKAERLGARPVGAGPGDVVLPDGRPVWVDGGPRRCWPAGLVEGAAVVHAESVERERLTVAPPSAPPSGVLAADLAPDQLAAVAHDAGPARVIAPAGSGKTRVLTERLRHVLADRGWEPNCVLAVAYNKKAQEELDQRTAGIGARTRTLNSLGLAVIARARGRPPAVLDERDVRRIVERLAPPTRRRSNTDPIAPYLEGLSAVRLGLRDPAEVESSRDDVPGLAELWPGFRTALAEAGAVDFDEQVYGAVEHLLGDGALRAEVRLGCRHLLVDEFQDLTPAHVLLLRTLAAPALDCFGVGDDDQVIYGHAGADPRFLLDYDRLFPGAADHRLEVNYRCRPEVVAAAATLLRYNRRRVEKTIGAARPPAPQGPSPALDIRTHPTGEGVAGVVGAVRSRLESG
ncbi:MAG: UvrD-helicase domain-containing protein, partial [Acidimicrobiales bacterium]